MAFFINRQFGRSYFSEFITPGVGEVGGAEEINQSLKVVRR